MLAKKIRHVAKHGFGEFGLFSAKVKYLNRERYNILRDAFMYTKNEGVVGDYFEFGVARGRTLIYAFQLEQLYRAEQQSRFFVFDSFEGFPKPVTVDAIHERFKENEESHSEKILKKNMKRHNVDASRVDIFPAYYKELSIDDLSRSGCRNARIIHIDCDLYESTRQALNLVRPFVQDGTVILFDDFLCYRGRPDRGEQKAFYDWINMERQIGFTWFKRYANVGNAFVLWGK